MLRIGDVAQIGLKTGQIGLKTGQIGLQTGQIGLQTGQIGLQTGQIGLQTGQIGLQTGRAVRHSIVPHAAASRSRHMPCALYIYYRHHMTHTGTVRFCMRH